MEAKQGMVIEACSQQCANNTPSNLVGVWRGIEAQKGFILGEWDYNFTNTSVTIRDPSGTITHGTVSVVNNMVITLTDGPHKGSKINVLVTEMSYGPETLTSGFSLSNYDSPVPDSIADAFDGVVCCSLMTRSDALGQSARPRSVSLPCLEDSHVRLLVGVRPHPCGHPPDVPPL